MPRKSLILAPLTAVAVLGVAAPSLAADFTVDVTPDFSFAPKERKIAVGDSVTWTFTDGGHTTTSRPDQPLKWNSKVLKQGQTFKETFTKPGAYQYYCIPHRDFMKGTIVVGTDTVKKTVGAVSAKVSGSKATIGFKLNEAAVVGVKLKGPSKKTVKAKRLAAGKRSVVVKRLKEGSYTATITLSDDFDHKTTKKKTFKVGLAPG
jgi:plastocyanin